MNKKSYEVTAWQVISISLNKIVETVVMTRSSSLWLNARPTADYDRRFIARSEIFVFYYLSNMICPFVYLPVAFEIFSEFFQNPSKTSRFITLSQHFISDWFKQNMWAYWKLLKRFCSA